MSNPIPSVPADSGDRPRRVLIAGASGLLGGALVARLEARGCVVIRLVRRAVRNDAEAAWNPAAGELDPGVIEGVDAVVNLSGENIGAGRWTRGRREAILRSRVDATRTLVAAITRASNRPRVLVSASAVGFYGDRGDAILTEKEPVGRGFLAEVCRAWEDEARGAARAGVRTVMPRFGVVLTAAGGALAKLLPLFRAGLGGQVGPGTQWMSWISLDDALGVISHAISEPRCEGPLNAVAPEAVTNAEFTRTLARVVRRPAIFPVPAVVLRAVFGEMADATLLASTRATPLRLVETGYGFQDPTLAEALTRALDVAAKR